MNIGIIGSGRIGSGLAKHWVASGHRIMFGSRHPDKAQEVADSLGSGTQVGSVADAAQFGEVVVLAVPWTAAEDALQSAGSLAGKTLIETTNPIGRGPDGMAMVLPPDTSAAEEIARMAPGAHVVKVFNTTYAQLVHNGGQFGDQRANVFLCGDDDGAKETVKRLAEAVGFEPIDIGPLRMARFLEPFTAVIVTLQRLPGMDSDMGYRILRR